MLAAEMGRPPLLPTNICDVAFLSETESDEFEIVSGSRGVRSHAASVMNACARLYQILEEVLFQFYGSRHSRRKAQSTLDSGARLRMYHILDERLDTLYDSWPPHLRFEYEDMAATGVAPGVCFVVVWWHVTRILLQRPFLPKTCLHEPESFAAQCHRKCTRSAHVVVKMVEGYSRHMPLNRVTPDNPYAIFTAAVVHAYNLRSADSELATEAKAALRQCRVWLEVSQRRSGDLLGPILMGNARAAGYLAGVADSPDP
jgi:hypothetical protein